GAGYTCRDEDSMESDTKLIFSGGKTMREILFKAKRKDNGKWVEGYYRRIPCMGMLEHYIMPRNPKNRMEQYAIDPDTLCQYTGLTDKNGRKIWENDIVQAWSEGSNAIGKVIRRVDGLYIMYPAYQKKEFWGLYPNKNGKTTVEVIGNIFDNAGLLEVE
ncbi:MAG: YopX family protein, partial [Lachnospiraceae bacterium]